MSTYSFHKQFIEDAYGGSSPHSYTVCVCDYSRSRGRHKGRHPRKAKSAYLQNLHICKSCVSAQPAYLQNLTENLRKQDRTSWKNHRLFMIVGALGASGADLAKKVENVPRNYANKNGLGDIFRSLSPISGHRKKYCFSDPASSVQDRPRTPQKAAKADFRPHLADSGPPFGSTFGRIRHF